MNVAERPRLSRQAIGNRLAMEFMDGWLVNLGIGVPTLCSNYVDPRKTITYHAENGVVGYGPLAGPGEEDQHLVNAGAEYVSHRPGMAIMHQADSFALIRSGKIDVTVLGAYQVSENGDFANWRMPQYRGGSIGGAMDLAVGAKRVFIAMEHTTKDGRPRLMKRCTFPITAMGVVKLVGTDLGLFEIAPDGFKLLEYAPGWSIQEIQDLTDATLITADDLAEFRFND